MANETLYPFGQGGGLPAGYPIINDTRSGGANKALSAEMGKYLQDQINAINENEVQTYGKLVPMNTYSGYTVQYGGTLAQSQYSNSFVNEFPIDLVNKDYIASYGFGATQTASYTFNYYDEEWNYLGGAYYNPGGESATSLTMANLVYPDSWQSDLDTYKDQAKFLRITGWTGSREATLYETWTIPQSILARTATPNEIMIFASVIQSPFIPKYVNDTTEITTTDVVSPWGIVFPDTYTVTGNPTPIIAQLHGSSGYVTEGNLGYSSSGWVAMRNAYLAAGFAVMDINGYGVSTEADAKSKHWGCPLAIETLDKAFEFLKQNFNVCDKILLHGTSMGGILAESYTKCFPGKVAGVGLFSSNLFAYSARFTDDSTKYLAWGYADKAAAEADNFNNLTGYIPLNECQIANDSTGVISQFDWSDYDYDTRQQILTKKLIDHFPVQVRMWHGAGDSQVPPTHATLLYNSWTRGNSPVSLRLVTNLGHEVESVSSYVRNEAVSWFKRFISTQNISE